MGKTRSRKKKPAFSLSPLVWLLVCLIGLFLLVLPSFSRHSQAQTTNSLTEGVSFVLTADKRVIDVTKGDDKITFTATLTKNGQPLANYPIRGINGSELFPDKNGKIVESDLKTDATGKATFTYVAGNSVEDIVDVSAMTDLGLPSDQPVAQSLVGVAYAIDSAQTIINEARFAYSYFAPTTTVVRQNPNNPDSPYAGLPNQPDAGMDQTEVDNNGTPSTGGDGGQTESAGAVLTLMDVPASINQDQTSFKITGTLTYNGATQLGSVTISGATGSDGATIPLPVLNPVTVGQAGSNSPGFSFQFLNVPKGDRVITVSVKGNIILPPGTGTDTTAVPQAVEITQGTGAPPSGSEDTGNQPPADTGGTGGGTGDTNDISGDSQTQTVGLIDLQVTLAEGSSGTDTLMFPFKISARYNGNPIAAQIKAFPPGKFTAIKSIPGADGDYVTTYSLDSNDRGKLIDLNFEATSSLNGKPLSGGKTYELNTAYNNPLSGDRVRNITVKPGFTELTKPTRNIGDHTFSGDASDLRGGISAGRDGFTNAIKKLGNEGNGYTSIDVSVTGGDGKPVPNAEVEISVTTPGSIAKSGSVACDPSTTSLCTTKGDVYKNIFASTKGGGTSNDGTLTVYFFMGISSQSATVSFRHHFYSDLDAWTYAEPDPTTVTFVVKGGGAGGGNGAGGDQSKAEGTLASISLSPANVVVTKPGYENVGKSTLTIKNNTSGTISAAAGIGQVTGTYITGISDSRKGDIPAGGVKTIQLTVRWTPTAQEIKDSDSGNPPTPPAAKIGVGASIQSKDGSSSENLNVTLAVNSSSSGAGSGSGGSGDGGNGQEKPPANDNAVRKEQAAKLFDSITCTPAGVYRTINCKYNKDLNPFLSAVERLAEVEISAKQPDQGALVFYVDGSSQSQVEVKPRNITQKGSISIRVETTVESASFTITKKIWSLNDRYDPLEQIKTYSVKSGESYISEGDGGGDNTNMQTFEFDPSQLLQAPNIQGGTNDAWSQFKDLSFVSKSDKDKIRAELDKINSDPNYRNTGLNNISSIVRSSAAGLSGYSNRGLDNSDPEYRQAYDALGDLSHGHIYG